MNVSDINKTIRHLYEGTHVELGCPLSEDVCFKDPLVIVSGRHRVVRMFKRLNGIFPASELEVFTPIDGSTHRYDLCMQYRRTPDAAPRTFLTVMELTIENGEIRSIVEHWRSPVNLNGDTSNPVMRLIRRTLGRLLS